jgi:hypothetical protein
MTHQNIEAEMKKALRHSRKAAKIVREHGHALDDEARELLTERTMELKNGLLRELEEALKA